MYCSFYVYRRSSKRKTYNGKPCAVRREGYVDRDLGVADGSVYLHAERYTDYFKQADLKNYQNIIFDALFIYRLSPKDNAITVSRLRKAFYSRFSTVDNLIIVKDANRQITLPSDLQVLELPDTYSCGLILSKLYDRDTFNVFTAFSDFIYEHIKNKVKIPATSKVRYERLKNLKNISNMENIIWKNLSI